MQTILGAGGAIGTDLARSLPAFAQKIRLVSRHPRKVNAGDELFPADLTQRDQVFSAVRGSEVVYLTVGLPYTIRVWRTQWPALMQNVIDACAEHKAKLVFFDNIYALGGDKVKHMTEETPIGPTSKKGEVRAKLDSMILDSIKQGRFSAIIARSPDFYGPIKGNSPLMVMVYDNLVQGKKAQWFCDAKVPHSCGYTPELAKAVARLGNTLSAFNQIWNLPVDKPITAEEWVKLFAEALKIPAPKVQVLPGWGMKLAGFFVPVLREMYEMRYQFDREYFFDSAKFEKAFNHQPLGNQAAVRETVEALRAQAAGARCT